MAQGRAAVQHLGSFTLTDRAGPAGSPVRVLCSHGSEQQPQVTVSLRVCHLPRAALLVLDADAAHLSLLPVRVWAVPSVDSQE